MQYVLAIYIHFIIILCFREVLGPILGGAIVYKVGFRSMTAVSLADNVCCMSTHCPQQGACCRCRLPLHIHFFVHSLVIKRAHLKLGYKMFDILHVGFKPQHLGLPLIVHVLMITVQNQTFCDSALWHLLLHSWEKKQLLLFCYHSFRIFIMQQLEIVAALDQQPH